MASFPSIIPNRETFELSGAREMVGVTRAEELLRAVEINEENCSAIKLCNKSFSPEAAALIIEKIRKCPTILYADISDIIAGRPEEEALKTLSVVCDGLMTYRLKEVNLSDNALGKKGINACSGVLVGKAIEKLYLCNNGLSAEACSTVSEILLDGGCPPLTALQFYNNMSGSNGAVAISKVVEKASLLQDFRFSATRSGNEGCLAIAKAVGELEDLHKLDVSDNSFGEEAAIQLANSLAKQRKLTHLNLRDSGLTEAGALEIISKLSAAEHRAPIVFLDLSGNDLTVEFLEPLVDFLSVTPTIEELYLDDNEIETDGAKVLASSIKKLENLRILSTCTCDLTAAGAYALAKEVSKLPKFSTLRIDGNQISSHGVKAIRSLLLKANKTLGDMDENDEDGDDDFEDDEDSLASELASVSIA